MAQRTNYPSYCPVCGADDNSFGTITGSLGIFWCSCGAVYGAERKQREDGGWSRWELRVLGFGDREWEDQGVDEQNNGLWVQPEPEVLIPLDEVHKQQEHMRQAGGM